MMKLDRHRALLLSDQSVVRAGLRLLLQEAGWKEVVESSLDSKFAVRGEATSPFGITIVDAAQTWDRCLLTVSQLQEADPTTPVLVLSCHKGSRYARAALEIGARGYVLEQASKEEFQVACWAVLQGGIYIDPKVVPGLLQDLGRPEVEVRKAAILRGLARGASNQLLATELCLSVSSIKMSVRELFLEYGVRSRLELLAVLGSRNGFQTLNETAN